MRVELNGEAIRTQATTLSGLIEERNLPAASVATAVNGDFVPRTLRDGTALSDGMRIEILSPMQGG
ncbi:sulfur carrier protein ThiS [Paracoccus onubensis]|uniref:sulfur carrier protein ThiS n=1 Tax=Paracoccus onubensis TaxID=1675788 RepID=UPI00272F84C3|nr:sulfur carrier protein ThiS [Paracoccus onubensis]MDP0927272.1 sulfur carrier protein ThiS [Paracoccus onubensis]